METRSTNGKRTAVAVLIGVLIAGGLAVGVVAYRASRGRQTQLQDDEVGRQRDAVLNAAESAKPKMPTTAAADAMAASRPASR